MEPFPIDFDEVEAAEWTNYGEDFPHSSSGRLSAKILRDAIDEVANAQPFLDYASFLSYIAALRIDTIPNSDLRRLERIGFGATRSVFRATCPSLWKGTHVAVKRLNLEIPQTRSAILANTVELDQQLAEASLELRVLSNTLLRFHRNIVDLLAVSWEEVGCEQSNDEGEKPIPSSTSIRPLLVVELAYQKYPTLQEYFKYANSQREKISTDRKTALLSDIAEALSAVHACGVVHGDIKPQNVLIFRRTEDGSLVAKLSDFGGCYSFEEAKGQEAQRGVIAYNLAGTEYWNAPEAYSKDNPAFARETRDYYSFGLLTFYVLFESLPFGDEEDNNAENMERIMAIKNDSVQVRNIVKKEFSSHWQAAFSKNNLDVLRSIEGFYERQQKLRSLKESGQVLEVFRGGESWVINKSEDFRHYSLHFVMQQFLRYDPPRRRQGGLMSDFRLFVNDKSIASSLRDIHLMQAWDTFWSSYEAEEFNFWRLSTLFQEGQQSIHGSLLSNPRHVSLAWKSPPVDLSREFARENDMDSFQQLPSSLKEIFMRELYRKLETTTGPEKIVTLLAVASFKALSFDNRGNEEYGLMLEAARLGSSFAKHSILVFIEDKLVSVEISPQDRLQWFYDVLLVQMPSKESFKNRMKILISDMALHIRVIGKVFEVEGLQSREVLKKAIKADDEQPLIRQAYKSTIDGDIDSLRDILEDAFVDIRDSSVSGYNLLHVAAEYGHTAIVQMLVQQFGMDVDFLTSDGVPASVLALRACSLDMLACLLTLGADFKRVLGTHTLRCIASYGGPRSLRQISGLITVWNDVENENNVFPRKSYLDGTFSAFEENVPDDEPDFPPVFGSILGNNTGTLWSLLEMGCSTSITVDFGSGRLAPIHVAANLRPLHSALLLHYGADVNLRTQDENMWTALHIACVAQSVPEYLFPRVQMTSRLHDDKRLLGLQPADHNDAKLFAIDVLVGYGADVNSRDFVGRTALAHCMSAKNSIPIARHLVDNHGAKIHIKDFRGLSCLHRAVVDQSDDTALLDFCLEKGILIDEPDFNGMTPLMMAVVTQKMRFICALLERGASPVAAQSKGWSCLDLAVKQGWEEGVEALFQTSESQGNLRSIATRKDVFLQTLLHKLVNAGEAFFEKFIDHFPERVIHRLISEHDIVGFTLVHHAVQTRNSRAVAFFLRHGADVNAKGWHELRPLHIAYGIRDQTLRAILENAGASSSAEDCEGRTPLEYASLSTQEPGFWTGMIEKCRGEGDLLANPFDNAKLLEIEQENRAHARKSEGW